MARPARDGNAQDLEKAAMLRCSRMVAELIPAAGSSEADLEHPAILEAIQHADSAERHMWHLYRTSGSWIEAERKLRPWIATYPTPVLDLLRAQNA